MSNEPNNDDRPAKTIKSGCANCRFRRYAERKPQSWIARLWRWHTGWCPGWKAYQRELAEQQEVTPDQPT